MTETSHSRRHPGRRLEAAKTSRGRRCLFHRYRNGMVWPSATLRSVRSVQRLPSNGFRSQGQDRVPDDPVPCRYCCGSPPAASQKRRIEKEALSTMATASHSNASLSISPFAGTLFRHAAARSLLSLGLTRSRFLQTETKSPMIRKSTASSEARASRDVGVSDRTSSASISPLLLIASFRIVRRHDGRGVIKFAVAAEALLSGLVLVG
jgi:hypothetical protein